MPDTIPTDLLFDAINAIRGTPLVPGEPQARAQVQRARDRGRRWHKVCAQGVLSIRVPNHDHDEEPSLADASLADFNALDFDWTAASRSAHWAVRCRPLAGLRGA